MRLKKIIIMLIVIICIIASYSLYKVVDRKKSENIIINEITKCYKEDRNIDLSSIGIKDIKCIDKSEQYLAVAYYKLQNEENTEAVELLKKSVENFNSRTGFKVKYLTLDLLLSELFNNECIEEALEYLLKIKDFSYKELSNNANNIKYLLDLAAKKIEGREVIIDILEDIMEEPDKLEEEAKSSYANALGMIFAMQGDYSKGIGILLESIGDLENGITNSFQLKSIVEIGNVYSQLGEIEMAESIYRKVIELNTSNEKIENYIMVYSYVNLYEMLIYQEKYEEFFDIVYEIDKYTEGVDESFIEGSMRLRDISAAHGYIFTDQEEKAYEKLIGLDKYNKSTYIDSDVYIGIVWGDYYYKIGEYEKAFNIYEKAYLEQKDLMNAKYEEMLINRIINSAHYLGKTDVELEYKAMLSNIYKNSIKTISEEYITYIIEKYYNEKELSEAYIAKLKTNIINIIMLFSGIFILFQSLKYMKKNNLDELTGVYNRKYFSTIFNRLFKQKKNFYMIIYDIDDFKKVNDTYGHALGDEVIKSIANIAASCTKNYGKVFRYGGEEFIVILDNCNLEKVKEIAENIRSKVEENQWHEGIIITISLGISSKLDTKEETFEKADNNLYISKNNGKNRITYYQI